MTKKTTLKVSLLLLAVLAPIVLGIVLELGLDHSAPVEQQHFCAESGVVWEKRSFLSLERESYRPMTDDEFARYCTGE
jgi:hypothetical protein